MTARAARAQPRGPLYNDWQSNSLSANGQRTRQTDSRGAGARVHRLRRAGALVAAREPGRPRRVVGDRAQHSGPARGRRVTCSSRTPRRAAFRPIAATASTSTCCSSRSARSRTARRGRSAAAARRGRPRWSTPCCPQASHVVSQASGTSASRCGRRIEAAVFDRVEFVPLSSSRVLVVIVARGGHVVQKVIEVSEPLGADELRQAANYLNAEFSRPAAAPRPRSGARTDERGAAAVRRAARPRDAAGDVDVLRSAGGARCCTSTAPRRCSAKIAG